MLFSTAICNRFLINLKLAFMILIPNNYKVHVELFIELI